MKNNNDNPGNIPRLIVRKELKLENGSIKALIFHLDFNRGCPVIAVFLKQDEFIGLLKYVIIDFLSLKLRRHVSAIDILLSNAQNDDDVAVLSWRVPVGTDEFKKFFHSFSESVTNVVLKTMNYKLTNDEEG